MAPVDRTKVGNTTSTPRIDPTLSGIVAPSGFVAASATLNGSLFSDLLASSMAATGNTARLTSNRPAQSARTASTDSVSRTDAPNGSPTANSDTAVGEPAETASKSKSAPVRSANANSPSQNISETGQQGTAISRSVKTDDPSSASKPSVDTVTDTLDRSPDAEQDAPVATVDIESSVTARRDADNAREIVDEGEPDGVVLDAAAATPIVATPVQQVVAPSEIKPSSVVTQSSQPVNTPQQQPIVETNVEATVSTTQKSTPELQSQTSDFHSTPATRSQTDSQSRVSLTPVSFTVPTELAAEASTAQSSANRNAAETAPPSNAALSLTTNFAPGVSTTVTAPVPSTQPTGPKPQQVSAPTSDGDDAALQANASSSTSPATKIDPAVSAPNTGVFEVDAANSAETAAHRTEESGSKSTSVQSSGPAATNSNASSAKEVYTPGFAAALLAAVTRVVTGGKPTATDGRDRSIDGAKLRLDAGSTVNSSFLKSTLADGSSLGSPIPPEQQAATLRHATDGIRLAIRNGREVSISLTPGELGQMTVRVTTDQGVVSAKIEAQTAAGYRALNDSLPQLRESLQQHGLVIDRVEVSLAERSNGDTRGGNSDRNSNTWNQSGWGSQSDGSSGQQRSESEARSDTTGSDSPLTDRQSTPQQRGLTGAGRLDLQV